MFQDFLQSYMLEVAMVTDSQSCIPAVKRALAADRREQRPPETQEILQTCIWFPLFPDFQQRCGEISAGLLRWSEACQTCVGLV